MYEEFEAPGLQRVGERLGPFGIHSCGSWEHTIPSVRRNPNIRAMNGHSRENDLPTLCHRTEGQLLLSIGPSGNVHEHLLWPNIESFYRHLLAVVPPAQPIETNVAEDNLPLWMDLYNELRGETFPLTDPTLS